MKMLFAVNKDSFTFSLSRYGEQLLTFQYRTEQVIKNKHMQKEKKKKKKAPLFPRWKSLSFSSLFIEG